jgi:hypothetical protein
MDKDQNTADPEAENEEFLGKAQAELRRLFDTARRSDEVQFALALAPEFRGEQGPGWCTAEEAYVAFDQYVSFLKEGGANSFKVRVALAFYSHLAEASGLYEVPKNMLRVAENKPYLLWPFHELVKTHGVSGRPIAPNASKVFRDLAEHAKAIGFDDLALVFRDAFDHEVRNGYAHADYIVWSDGIRLRNRHGGHARIVSWDEFNVLFHRGINFFNILRTLVGEYVDQYDPPKKVIGHLGQGPPRECTIAYDRKTGQYSISSSSP